jgi:hypothetical protein
MIDLLFPGRALHPALKANIGSGQAGSPQDHLAPREMADLEGVSIVRLAGTLLR